MKCPEMETIVWRETLPTVKFSKFATKLILAKENLANLSNLRLKNVLRNSSLIFDCMYPYKCETISYDKTLKNAVADCMDLSLCS